MTSMFDEPSAEELRERERSRRDQEIRDHDWAVKEARRDIRDLSRLLGEAETRFRLLENSRPQEIKRPVTMFD